MFHFEVPGGKWQTRMLSPVVSARRCSSWRHRRVRGLLDPPESAVIVSVARVRVAVRAEVLPPADDRVDRELGGIAGDPDADPALVRGQVVDAVRDRVPELLVLEVMTADLDRPALGLKLAADRLEIADQLSLLGVHADHRLTRRDRLADGLVDVRKLRVAIRVLGALPRLLVRLQAVPLGLQQPQHGAIDDIMAHLPQRLGELRAALRRPPQRRLRIPRVTGSTSRSRSSASPGSRSRIGVRPGWRRTFPGAGRSSESRSARPRSTVDSEIPVALTTADEPPIASRPSLRRRPQPPGALIQHPLRVQQPIPLTDRALIDHNPQFYITSPAPSQTKSRALSICRGWEGFARGGVVGLSAA